ncbi:hypothetical protein V5O48_012421 [Marasmius crinis-equi]|uniref:Uncharacterized protein n=1 Tax=Marasmius crinis-equi TaxID=585013 RepID=A0ABR3F2V1_9AGAR
MAKYLAPVDHLNARFNWYKVRSICQIDPHPAPKNLTQFVDEPYKVYNQETLNNLTDHFSSEPYTIEEPAPTSNSSEDTIMHAPDSKPILNDSEDVDMAADSIDPPSNKPILPIFHLYATSNCRQ